MLKSGKAVDANDIVNSDLLKRLVEQRVLLRFQLAEQVSERCWVAIPAFRN